LAQGSTAPSPTITSKWSTSFYGFVETDFISDSTESFNESAGNGAISRPGSYAATHKRFMIGARHSRIGFRLNVPELGGIRTSANIEADFLGNQPSPLSESAFFVNPTFRLRHAFMKIETEYVDVLIGQTWQLFGWQGYFHPNTVEIQGVPGQVFSRSPQIRLSHTFKLEPVSVEVAVAASRPPSATRGYPMVRPGSGYFGMDGKACALRAERGRPSMPRRSGSPEYYGALTLRSLPPRR